MATSIRKTSLRKNTRNQSRTANKTVKTTRTRVSSTVAKASQKTTGKALIAKPKNLVTPDLVVAQAESLVLNTKVKEKENEKTNENATRHVRHPDELSDKALAALVAKGDQKAWRLVYDKWCVELTRYGVSQGWDRELVADLVQDTMIRAWSKRTAYNSKYPYRVWILTIFRRLAMTHYRRVKTHTKTVDQKPAKTGIDPWWAENQTDMSGIIDTNDIRSILEPLINGLKPEDQRLLKEWSRGVCQATLAKELGTNPVTLRTQILRAKARLLKAFKEKYPELAKAGWASQND